MYLPFTDDTINTRYRLTSSMILTLLRHYQFVPGITVIVICISSRNSMLSALSYDTYKSNTPSQWSSIVSRESTRTICNIQHLHVRSILVSNSSEGYQWVSVIAGREKTKISEREQFYSYQGKNMSTKRS